MPVINAKHSHPFGISSFTINGQRYSALNLVIIDT